MLTLRLRNNDTITLHPTPSHIAEAIIQAGNAGSVWGEAIYSKWCRDDYSRKYPRPRRQHYMGNSDFDKDTAEWTNRYVELSRHLKDVDAACNDGARWSNE